MFKCECGGKFPNVRVWPLYCSCRRKYDTRDGHPILLVREPALAAKVVSFCEEKAAWLAAAMPIRSE